MDVGEGACSHDYLCYDGDLVMVQGCTKEEWLTGAVHMAQSSDPSYPPATYMDSTRLHRADAPLHRWHPSSAPQSPPPKKPPLPAHAYVHAHTYHEGRLHEQHVVSVRVVARPLQSDVVKVGQLLLGQLLDRVLQRGEGKAGLPCIQGGGVHGQHARVLWQHAQLEVICALRISCNHGPWVQGLQVTAAVHAPQLSPHPRPVCLPRPLGVGTPRTRPYLYLEPAPGAVQLAQVLLNKGEGLQAARHPADDAAALGVQPEVVPADLSKCAEKTN